MNYIWLGNRGWTPANCFSESSRLTNADIDRVGPCVYGGYIERSNFCDFRRNGNLRRFSSCLRYGFAFSPNSDGFAE